MKKLFLLSVVALATATLTTTAFAAAVTLTWNGLAGVIDASGFYDFNNGGNWVGGVAPDGTDSTSFGYATVEKIRFTADTVIGRSATAGMSFNGSGGKNVVFEGKSVTFYNDAASWYAGLGATNVFDNTFTFNNTVIFQNALHTGGGQFVMSNSPTSAATPALVNRFERILIKGAANGLGGTVVSMTSANSNTRNRMWIVELADFYTHPTTPSLSSTGTVIFGSLATTVVPTYDLVKTFGDDADENFWEFSGTISLQNGQLNLHNDLAPKCTFTIGGGAFNMLNLMPSVTLTKNFNLTNYVGVARMGILDSGLATIKSNIAAARTVSSGALVHNVAFIAGLTTSTLIYEGKLTGAAFIGAELQFQGNGYIFLRGNAANGNVPMARFSGGTIGLANGTSEVVLGGNFSYDGPMKVYNGAGLTNQEGVMNFTNTVVDATVTVNPQAAGFDMSLMNTNGKLVFKLETTATTYQIQATLLNIGSLDSYEFFFLRGTGFGEGDYTLFSSPNAITSTFLDTVPFFLDQAQTWQGQLAWGADNKSILLNVVAVPEPATWLLLGASLLVVTLFRRKKLS